MACSFLCAFPLPYNSSSRMLKLETVNEYDTAVAALHEYVSVPLTLNERRSTALKQLLELVNMDSRHVVAFCAVVIFLWSASGPRAQQLVS